MHPPRNSLAGLIFDCLYLELVSLHYSKKMAHSICILIKNSRHKFKILVLFDLSVICDP
jgi:hypothetical protein